MPHLDVPDATLYYETSGPVSAPAILLVHAGIATLRMWDAVSSRLDADHFVIRADGRGFGQTSAAGAPFSERDDARDLLDHLGVERATIVGSSRGGGIAIDLALESPERVAGVVTIGSSVSGHPPVTPTAAEDAFHEQLHALVDARDWHAAVQLQTEALAIGPNRTATQLDPQFVELAFNLNRPNAARYPERARPARLEPPAYARLGDISVPVLASVGAQDFESFLTQQRSIATRIDGAEEHVFPDAAHLPSLERPAEFISVVQDWIARHSL